LTVAEGRLAIKNHGFRGQLCNCRGNHRVTLSEIVSILAEQCNVFDVFVNLDAIAIEFHFVEPQRVGRRLRAECRRHRNDKTGLIQHSYCTLTEFENARCKREIAAHGRTERCHTAIGGKRRREDVARVQRRARALVNGTSSNAGPAGALAAIHCRRGDMSEIRAGVQPLPPGNLPSGQRTAS
jgi:hypothetical protein